MLAEDAAETEAAEIAKKEAEAKDIADRLQALNEEIAKVETELDAATKEAADQTQASVSLEEKLVEAKEREAIREVAEKFGEEEDLPTLRHYFYIYSRVLAPLMLTGARQGQTI